MQARYFDSHCHIQFDAYDGDRAELFAHMEKEQVGGIVVGVDLESSKRAVALVESRPNFFASVGLHPNDTHREHFDFDMYRELARSPKVVAIGECGLDNFRPEDVERSKPIQREVFLKHVELALELEKPLMIHARPRKGTQDAYSDLLDILRSTKREHGEKVSGNIHFFVGGVEEARSFVDIGFTISYTAVLTFTHDYDEVVRFVPLSHLLTETDSPYVSPPPHRGSRNDPRAVRKVVEAVAHIRGEDHEMVRETLVTNAKRVFKLP
jgi:TatD DNase family protein